MLPKNFYDSKKNFIATDEKIIININVIIIAPVILSSPVFAISNLTINISSISVPLFL